MIEVEVRDDGGELARGNAKGREELLPDMSVRRRQAVSRGDVAVPKLPGSIIFSDLLVDIDSQLRW